MSQDQESQLQELRKRIEALSTQLNESRSVRDVVVKELRHNEIESGRLIRQMRAIDGALASSEARLTALTTEKTARRRALREQRALLKRFLRASYRTSHQDYLKVLLNAQDPASLARSLTYYGYFQRVRTVQIGTLRSELESLTRIEADITARRSALKQLQAEKSDTRLKLERHRTTRQALLVKLGTEITTQTERLEQLKLDEQKLEDLLSNIQRELADLAAIAVDSEPFEAQRGKLPWPSRGALLHRFGSPRRSTSVRWQGVLIGVAEGEPVHAISHGRVAFADWLRGFGLLLIIDHGDGYMSLYGRNESLLKEVGDWVNPGEPIAVVGQGGDSAEQGLYFEIRHNGIPKNPVKWCRREGLDSSGVLVSG